MLSVSGVIGPKVLLRNYRQDLRSKMPLEGVIRAAIPQRSEFCVTGPIQWLAWNPASLGQQPHHGTHPAEG